MTRKSDAKLEKKLICYLKMTRIERTLTWVLESLINLYFHWFLLCKVYTVWPKTYRGVIFHETEEWCKVWRKTDLWPGKWREDFEELTQSSWKSQIWDFDGILLSKVENTWAKNLQRIYFYWHQKMIKNLRRY